MIGLQGTLFPPASEWRPPRLADLPADWNVTRTMSLDCETCDPLLKKLGIGVRRGGYIAGVAFALSKDKGWYLPIKHLGGDNMEEVGGVIRYLRDQARRYTGRVVGAKISYDLDYLATQYGIEFPNADIADVQVAEPLIDELQYSFSLDNILKRHGLPLKDETLLREAAAQFKLDPKKDLWKLPARYVGPYAEGDVNRPLLLLERQEAIMEERGLMRIWELERAVTPVLVKMRRRGVRIDFDQLDRMDRFSRAEEMKVWGEVHRLTGIGVEVGQAMNAALLARVLATENIHTPMTAAGKPSITKDWLEGLNHPLGGLIRRARKFSQLRTTFIASVRAHAVGDRIHCTFNQIVTDKDDGSDETEGAAYGRLSCVDPNLQQQPSPDRDPEIGKGWRMVYVPDEGGTWGQLDYSQQEPRLALHFAVASGPARIGEAGFRSAQIAAKRYWDDRNADAHTMFTQLVYGDDVVNEDPKVFKGKRAKCKNIFLGICYGMGGPKLCRQVGLPTKVIEHHRTGRKMEVAGDEGQALLNMVDHNVPYVRKTAQAVEAVAKERGYIVTIMGRHCHFPRDEQGNLDWTHKAFNRAIQGSAADQTKYAMVQLDRAGYPLQLQVHDEFDTTLESREQGLEMAKIMEECVPLHVPSKVDLEVGRSWGEVG